MLTSRWKGIVQAQKSLLQSCNHDLVVLVKRRGRLMFVDQMFKMADMWYRILHGEAFARVAHHEVFAGDKLQAAAAHACLFGEYFLPATEFARVVEEPAAVEGVLRQSCSVFKSLLPLPIAGKSQFLIFFECPCPGVLCQQTPKIS